MAGEYFMTAVVASPFLVALLYFGSMWGESAISNFKSRKFKKQQQLSDEINWAVKTQMSKHEDLLKFLKTVAEFKSNAALIDRFIEVEKKANNFSTTIETIENERAEKGKAIEANLTLVTTQADQTHTTARRLESNLVTLCNAVREVAESVGKVIEIKIEAEGEQRAEGGEGGESSEGDGTAYATLERKLGP